MEQTLTQYNIELKSLENENEKLKTIISDQNQLEQEVSFVLLIFFPKIHLKKIMLTLAIPGRSFWFLLFFLALFSSEKRRLCYRRVCLSLSQFSSRTTKHTTKIFSVALSIHMLEIIQIWFISNNAFGIKYKKMLKTRMKKAPHENYLVILFLRVTIIFGTQWNIQEIN